MEMAAKSEDTGPPKKTDSVQVKEETTFFCNSKLLGILMMFYALC